MNRKAIRGAMLAVALVVALLVAVVPMAAASGEQGARKIVVFESGRVNEAAVAKIERMGGVTLKRLPLIGAAAMRLPDAAVEHAVGRMSEVARVDDDIVVYATKRPAPTPPPAQVLPWGIERVQADHAWATTAGDPVKVAILDTGIDTAHPDLIANLKGGVSCVSYTAKYTDDNGHGTHVAGIVGAVNNTIGVVGVGPEIDLYAVKVLNRKGSGYLSDIVEGLQWAVDNDIKVVNMSLGATVDDTSFHAACTAAYNAGVLLVAAAGNEYPGTDTVTYPAKYAEVIAVSATNSSDGLAYFSSTGPAVELSAPGESVYSTYKGSTYKTLSGTSMASPHVAGVAGLVFDTPVAAAYDADADGTWDAAEVRAKLRASVDDLGTAGLDSQFGYGLVQADEAVAP